MAKSWNVEKEELDVVVVIEGFGSELSLIFVDATVDLLLLLELWKAAACAAAWAAATAANS